jgi:hypothetical protein
MKNLRKTFTTPYEQHRDREGQSFALVREITEAESDYDAEVLPMFIVRFPDGVEIPAWPEEVLASCDEYVPKAKKAKKE